MYSQLWANKFQSLLLHPGKFQEIITNIRYRLPIHHTRLRSTPVDYRI